MKLLRCLQANGNVAESAALVQNVGRTRQHLLESREGSVQLPCESAGPRSWLMAMIQTDRQRLEVKQLQPAERAAERAAEHAAKQ